MKYNGFTNAGSVYQAKCKANELPIKFVKVKIGNGLLEETEDPAKFMDVKNLKKEVGISEKTQIQDAVRLTIQMDNDGVTEGYFPREFGIYVEDEGVEVLYWYVNDGNEASYLPSQSTAPVKLKNHFNIIATSLESLVVNWSGKEFWIDKEYLEKELEKKQDMTDGKLLTAAKTIWGSINELFTKKANKDDVENNLITVDEGKILDARQGPAIVNKINGLAGGYSGTFPLTTAVKEGIYLLPATNKFYVCVENYSGSSLTAPNANFEELSVFQNRNKLENLFKNEPTLLLRTTIKNIGNNISKTFNLNNSLNNFSFILLLYSDSTNATNALDNAVSFVPIAMFKKFNFSCLETARATTYVAIKYNSNTKIDLHVFKYIAVEENDIVEVWAI